MVRIKTKPPPRKSRSRFHPTTCSASRRRCRRCSPRPFTTSYIPLGPIHPLAPQALPGIEPGDCIFLVQSGVVNVRHRPKDSSSDDAPPTRMQAGDVFGVGPQKHRQFLESLMEAAAGRVKAASTEGSSAGSNVFASNNQVRRPMLVHRAMHHCPSSNAPALCHNQVWIDPDDPEEYLLSSQVCATAHLCPCTPTPHPAPLPLRPCRAQPP